MTVSGSESKSVQTRKGFTRGDVSRFMQAGGRIASGADISKPGLKTQTIARHSKREKVKLFGKPESFDRVSVTGPSDFADISSEQLDALVSVFQKRQADVKQRRLQPGLRAQTLFTS